MAPASSAISASSFSSVASRAFDASSVSLRSASRSISSWIRRRSSSSSSIGIESISMRSRDAASSTRSIALSGRKRSVMYRSESVAAATSAESVIRTPWWTSYRSRRPRRIEIVSSTVGWSTNTCWKRRSRAASFSMCLRYSSRVVAPIVWSSPRASIGLSRFEASIAPSAAPAPTTVCSSSMNRITGAVGVLDLLQDGLEALLELATELRAGDEGAEVERDDALVLERSRGRRRGRSAGRGPPRSRSCRRPARRSGPGCSWSGATAPA